MRGHSYRKSFLILAICAVATVTACESKVPERAYIIEQTNADQFLALIVRTAALAGRHAVLPDKIDARANAVPIVCPSDKSDGIKVGMAGCQSAEAGDVSCFIKETYKCTMISGAITGAVSAVVGQGATIVLHPTGYVEGNNELKTSEVAYNGTLSIQTGAAVVSYTEDQKISAKVTDGTVINVDANGDYKMAFDKDQLTFSGKVSYNVSGVGLVNATITNMTFALKGDCSGMPNSGEIKVEIVGLESGIIRFTGCNAYDLVNLDLSGAEAKTTSFGKEVVAPLFDNAMQRADLLNFANAPFNAVPAAAFPYSNTDANSLSAPIKTWCRMLFSSKEKPVFALAPSVATDATTAQGRAMAAGAPQAECLTFVSMGTINTLAGPVTSKTIIATHVVFAGPLSDASKALIISSAAGLPVSYPADGTMTVTLASIADPATYPTQKSLSDAAVAMALQQGPNPYVSGKILPVTVTATYDFNHLGMWLESVADKTRAGLYFNVIGD